MQEQNQELETVLSGRMIIALWKSGGMENEPDSIVMEQMLGAGQKQLRKHSTEVIHRWRTILEADIPCREQEHKRQAGGSAGQQVQTMIPGRRQGV